MTPARRKAARRALTVLLVAGAGALAPACGRGDDVIITLPEPDADAIPCTVTSTDFDGGFGGPFDAGFGGVFDAGSGAPQDASVGVNGDAGACPSGQFCEPDSCEAHTGKCVDVPTTCTQSDSFVCGCNGVTYFNDCVRQMAKVGADSPGQCLGQQKAQGCGGSGKAKVTCPTTEGIHTVCALVIPASVEALFADIDVDADIDCLATLTSLTPNNSIGTCWALPLTAPATTTTELKQVTIETTGGQTPNCKQSSCLNAFDALSSGDGNVFVEATDCGQDP